MNDRRIHDKCWGRRGTDFIITRHFTAKVGDDNSRCPAQLRVQSLVQKVAIAPTQPNYRPRWIPAKSPTLGAIVIAEPASILPLTADLP
jgi:hypothetical protein